VLSAKLKIDWGICILNFPICLYHLQFCIFSRNRIPDSFQVYCDCACRLESDWSAEEGQGTRKRWFIKEFGRETPCLYYLSDSQRTQGRTFTVTLKRSSTTDFSVYSLSSGYPQRSETEQFGHLIRLWCNNSGLWAGAHCIWTSHDRIRDDQMVSSPRSHVLECWHLWRQRYNLFAIASFTANPWNSFTETAIIFYSDPEVTHYTELSTRVTDLRKLLQH
jgi:hypothetical protein